MPSTGISFSRTSGWSASAARSDGSGASRTLVSSSSRMPASAASAGQLWPSASMRIRPSGSNATAASASHLVLGEHARAHALELGDELVVDGVVDDERLLGRADHGRVEGLGDQDVHHGHRDVGAAVHVDGRVARADADAGLAGLVGRVDGLRAAGRPDEVDARRGGRGTARRRAWGRARPAARPAAGRPPRPRADDLDRALGAAGRARRRAEDHRVARLRGDDRLEQRRRGGVGDRQQREHDADRLGDLLERALGVLLDHADGALVSR